MSLRLELLRVLGSEPDAVVIEVVRQLLMQRSRHVYLQLRVRLLDQAKALLHHLGRPLIHSYIGPVEPPLCPHVLRKGVKHGRPKLCVGLASRLSLEELVLATHFIKVAEGELPWDHREAGDRLVDPEIHHEADPFVEVGVVEVPLAIPPELPVDHGVKGVVRLTIPGLVHDRCGDHLAPCVPVHLHIGAHDAEVLLRPRSHPVVPCYGIWILPQIEKEVTPLRQRSLVHHHRQRQCCQCLITAAYGHRRLVASPSRIPRNVYREPDRTRRAGCEIQ